MNALFPAGNRIPLKTSFDDPVEIAMVMPAGMAVGNGYMWLETTAKAYRNYNKEDPGREGSPLSENVADDPGVGDQFEPADHRPQAADLPGSPDGQPQAGGGDAVPPVHRRRWARTTRRWKHALAGGYGWDWESPVTEKELEPPLPVAVWIFTVILIGLIIMFGGILAQHWQNQSQDRITNATTVCLQTGHTIAECQRLADTLKK